MVTFLNTIVAISFYIYTRPYSYHIFFKISIHVLVVLCLSSVMSVGVFTALGESPFIYISKLFVVFFTSIN